MCKKLSNLYNNLVQHNRRILVRRECTASIMFMIESNIELHLNIYCGLAKYLYFHHFWDFPKVSFTSD